MYFSTPANGSSETKAVGDTITEPILMMYIYGRANAYNCLLWYILYISHHVQLQKYVYQL